MLPSCWWSLWCRKCRTDHNLHARDCIARCCLSCWGLSFCYLDEDCCAAVITERTTTLIRGTTSSKLHCAFRVARSWLGELLCKYWSKSLASKSFERFMLWIRTNSPSRSALWVQYQARNHFGCQLANLSADLLIIESFPRAMAYFPIKKIIFSGGESESLWRRCWSLPESWDLETSKPNISDTKTP